MPHFKSTVHLSAGQHSEDPHFLLEASYSIQREDRIGGRVWCGGVPRRVGHSDQFLPKESKERGDVSFCLTREYTYPREEVANSLLGERGCIAASF